MPELPPWYTDRPNVDHIEPRQAMTVEPTTDRAKRELADEVAGGYYEAPADYVAEVFATIEFEARAAALREVAEKVRALKCPNQTGWYIDGFEYAQSAVVAILTEAQDMGAPSHVLGASE